MYFMNYSLTFFPNDSIILRRFTKNNSWGRGFSKISEEILKFYTVKQLFVSIFKSVSWFKIENDLSLL